MVAEVSTVET